MKKENKLIEYTIIESYYGDTKAERSGETYITHINEGLKLLDTLKASPLAKAAFCLHPIVQSDTDFARLIASDSPIFARANFKAWVLATEYRRWSMMFTTDSSVAPKITITDANIKNMLIADKVQNMIALQRNRKKYDANEFKRLNSYFNSWMDILGVK